MGKTLKFSKQFDYTTGPGQPVTSYSPDGGDKRDGVYEDVPDKHSELALQHGHAAEHSTGKSTGGGNAGGGSK